MKQFYDVTIPYRKLPWYTVTGIEAKNRAEAIILATRQAEIENGKQPHNKPKVKVSFE